MHDAWATSAHARAARAPSYLAARADARDARCDGCHRPLDRAAPGEPVAVEGVTCDVCHTLRDPAPGPDGGRFRLAVDDMVKFGPRCDLEDHYFHRMGCSPEHGRAEVCGVCHQWERDGVPVLTDFADWQAGPAARAGVPCQGCHMPRERGAIAVGAPVRGDVPHHGLLGLASDLRARAVGLAVEVRADGDGLALAVTVANRGGGHALPGGVPERRLVVRARLRDAAGAAGEDVVRELGRRVVDAAGADAPFWRAARVAEDTRIPVGGAWREALALRPATPGAAGAVEVEVALRALPEAHARALGLPAPAEEIVARARVPFGPGRAGLPRAVTVEPPPASRRPGRRAR